jgi:hypothetical protein
MKRILACWIGAILILFPMQSFAVLGPVRVEMIKFGSMTRANKPSNIFIYPNIKVDIDKPTWVKVWMPIDEMDCNLSQACDGLKPLTGDVEDPRFVPNQKYFEKYPNSSESKYGKLYSVKNRKAEGTTFFEPEPCEDGKCRLIPDPSGLGSWITGTVMPKLEKEYLFREETLKKLSQDIDPCYPG